MTALMVLALTVPPSLAFIIERWMRGREAEARKLLAADTVRLDETEKIAKLEMRERMQMAEAELKRLNEQVSLLSDRYRA